MLPSLYGEFLFITTGVNRKAPASAIQSVLKTLDERVDSIVILPDK